MACFPEPQQGQESHSASWGGEAMGKELDALRCPELCEALRRVGSLAEQRAEHFRLSA